MIKAIAVDDEPIALEIIALHAQKIPFLQLERKFINALAALQYLKDHKSDVLFLDIKMPDISGIDFYRSLTHKPMLIFTTAYSEHAVTGFDLEAIDYLLKPITFPRFLKACNKIYDVWQAKHCNIDHVFVKDGADLIKIELAEISHIEATGNYVAYVLRDKQILTRSTIKETIELLTPRNFLQTHRSFIVNMDHVTRVERHQLHLGGHKIPVGASYSFEVRNKLCTSS